MSRAVDRIESELRTAILAPTWPVGSHLPPERQLADSVGVSRLTLRAALARLEASGLIRARQGSGYTVLDPWAGGGVDLLPHLATVADPALIAECLALRRTLAAEVVAGAAAQAATIELGPLVALATAQLAETDAAAFAARDLAFVGALLAAAGNRPARLLFNTFERLYRALPQLIAAMNADLDAIRASYAGVVGLIRAGDPEAARRAVRTLLESQDEATLRRLEMS